MSRKMTRDDYSIYTAYARGTIDAAKGKHRNLARKLKNRQAYEDGHADQIKRMKKK